jgi:hypothetical protein
LIRFTPVDGSNQIHGLAGGLNGGQNQPDAGAKAMPISAQLFVSSVAVGLMSLVVLAVPFSQDVTKPLVPFNIAPRPLAARTDDSPSPDPSDPVQMPPAPATPGQLRQSESKLREIASFVYTYRANAHKNPENLASLFKQDPDALRSPFAPGTPNAYVYLPNNIDDLKDSKIVLYDRFELKVTGRTQALTNGFKVLILSRDDLFTRLGLPH